MTANPHEKHEVLTKKETAIANGGIDDAVNKILSEIDLDGWTIIVPATKEALEKIYKEAAAHGISNLVEADLPIGISEENLTAQLNEAATSWAEDRAAELVGKKFVNGELIDNPNAEWAITDSTRDQLRTLINDAIDGGWSSDHLANEIESRGIFSEERAELVARTELKKSDQKGNVEAYKASGLDLEKSWQISADHPEEDDCDDAESDGWIDFDEDFSNGMSDPGDSHPNCLCVLLVRTVGAKGNETEE